MTKFKKLSIIGLSILLFVFSVCPVFATTQDEFINKMWINQNGYWLMPMPDNIKKYFADKDVYKFLLSPIYDKNNSGSRSGLGRGDVYYKYVNGSYQLDWVDDKANPFDTPQYSTYYTSPMIVDLNIENTQQSINKSYTDENDKKKLIEQCNKFGFVYEEQSDNRLLIYYPYFKIYFQSKSNDCIYTNYEGEYNSYTYENLNYYSLSFYAQNTYNPFPTIQAGYEYTLGFDTENNLIVNATPIYKYTKYENPASAFLLPSGYMYRKSNYFISTIDGYRIKESSKWENTNLKQYSGRNGLNITITLAIFPGTKDHRDSNNTKAFIDVANTQLLGCDNASCGVKYLDGLRPVYDIGMYNLIDKFFKGEQVPIPVGISNIIYNRHTYYNNRNNYYWWSTLNYNPEGGSGDIENPDDSNPSGDGSGSGGSGGGSSGGSGGDSSITIDTQNIENLLQQILEALQNQGTTEIDLTEIENLLNAIKNNLKDYTGDLSTINNTLTLINQFLNNNIDIPISDLKTLLNDIKTLSELQNEQLTGISVVLHDMKQLFIDIYNRLGEIKDKIGSTINNIEEGTNLWDVLKALIDNLGEFLSSGLELFEKLLVPQGTFQTDFNSTIAGIQDKLGVLYQPVDVFSNFLTNLYAPTETSSLADSGHVIKIPEAKYDGVTIIEAQSIDLDETVEKSGLKPLYDVYLLIVDMIVLFGILNLAFKKFHDIISENGGDYK